MLVLTRKAEESIFIGDANDPHGLVKVRVLSIDGGRIRLGIEANPLVSIDRLEVLQRMQANAEPLKAS